MKKFFFVTFIFYEIIAFGNKDITDPKNLLQNLERLNIKLDIPITAITIDYLNQFYNNLKNENDFLEVKNKNIKIIPTDNAKIYIQDNIIIIAISLKNLEQIDIKNLNRFVKVQNFILSNKLNLKYCSESELNSLELLSDIYNNYTFTKDLYNYQIEFEDLLKPTIKISKNFDIKLILPNNNSYNFWRNLLQKLKTNEIKDHDQILDFINNATNIPKANILKTIELFIAELKKTKTLLDRVKKDELSQILADNFKPQINTDSLLNLLYSIPYKQEVKNQKLNEIKTNLQKYLKNLKTIKASFLNKLREETLQNLIATLEENTTLQKINIIYISIASKNIKIKYQIKKQGIYLNLPDYATKTNILETLVELPIQI